MTSAAAMARAEHKLEVQYEFPFLAHATMEPLNCVADVRRDRCEIWVGTQFQTRRSRSCRSGSRTAPRAGDTAHDDDGRRIRAAWRTRWSFRSGSGAGVESGCRTGETDVDPLRRSARRLLSTGLLPQVTGGLGPRGEIMAWRHRVVGQSIFAGTVFEELAVANGIDGSSIYSPYYQWPNLRVELHTVQVGIPVWSWRSVGGTHNAFAVECFMDELAHAAGADPCEFRRALLDPQQRKIVDLVCEKSGWGQPLPAGRGRGIAVYPFDSFVAQVAEVTCRQVGSIQSRSSRVRDRLRHGRESRHRSRAGRRRHRHGHVRCAS